MAKSIFLALLALLLLLIATFQATVISATLEADEKECADQLQNLAACIPFVSGSAKKPTPECCADAEKVRASQPKCLCVLIKESTDPSLGLPVNTTLALQMPAACNSDAKVSDCPSILKLPPNSPDAKIFKDATATTSPSSTATSSSSGTSGSSSTGSGSDGGSGSKAGASSKGERSEVLASRDLLGLILLIFLLFI